VLAQVVRHTSSSGEPGTTPEIFVPEVDFVTAQGNVEAVVTPLGVLGLQDGHLMLSGALSWDRGGRGQGQYRDSP